MAYRRFRRSHVASIVRTLVYTRTTPERTDELLRTLREYNPDDVAAWLERLQYPPAPVPPPRIIRSYFSLDEALKRYNRPTELFRLADGINKRARELEGNSRIVRDHRNPYTEGGGPKDRVLKAVFETKICQNCRRAFLARRRDAKTCSPKCRTALHRKSK
jgi:hypothetical protein